MSSEAFEDVARLVVAATLKPGQTLRIVKYIAYGWSRVRSTPALLDQVSAALSEAHATGWDGLCAGAAQIPRRLLGTRGRGDRGRSRTATGDPFWDVPRVAGRCACGAASHRRQGAHGLRLRRPHLLGHRDVRAPDAHLHAATGRRRLTALEAPHTRARRERARPSWSSRARPSRGVRSTARSVRAIGRREPERSTSTRTSRLRPSAT